MRGTAFILCLLFCSIHLARAQQPDDWWTNELIDVMSLGRDGRFKAAIEKIETLLPQMEGMEDEAFVFAYGLQGEFYWLLNDLQNQETALLQALSFAKSLSDDRGIKRQLFIDIGRLYIDFKNYENAEKFLLVAKHLHEANLDLGFNYTLVLYNLGLAAHHRGNSFNAKLYFDTALDTLEGLGPEYDNDRASILGAIAVMCGRMGYLDEALQIVQEAKNIVDSLEDTHLECEVNYNMAIVYEMQGNWREAAACLGDILKRGNVDDIDASDYFYLSRANFFSGEPSFAEQSREASLRMRHEIISMFLFLTEAERTIYWGYHMPYFNVLNTMLSTAVSKENNLAILNNALFAKGLLLKTSTWISERIREASGEDDKAKMTERELLKARLDDKTLCADSADYYLNRVLMIEKELLRSNVDFSSLSDNLLADWKAISESLGEGEVAIEFAPMNEISAEDPYFVGEESYLAIILSVGCEYPIIVPICSEGDIKRLTDNRSKLSSSKFVNNLYSSSSPRNKGEELYELLWKPLEGLVSEAKIIYYSPIGALSSVSFNAISHAGEPLCERFDMRMVSSIAEIIRLKNTVDDKPSSALVYGGIAYDVDSSTLLDNARGYAHEEGGSVGEDEQERSGWRFLASTSDEALGICQKLEDSGVKTILRTGDSANEESFKSIAGQAPDIIHLATHGFFLSDPKSIDTNPFLNRLKEGARGQTVNYLNRSGLLFAGANRAWTGEGIVEGIDDGILTAEEVTGLDLSTTDVAILSACETGLGVASPQKGFSVCNEPSSSRVSKP